MLLGNDAAERPDAKTQADADRAFLLLKDQVRRLRQAFPRSPNTPLLPTGGGKSSSLATNEAFQQQRRLIWGDYSKLSEALAIDDLASAQHGVYELLIVLDDFCSSATPHLKIHFHRREIVHCGMGIANVQDVVEVAIGGRRVTTTVKRRERFPLRVRYLRELRNEVETMNKILVPTKSGTPFPLTQLAEIHYVRGPQGIKSEETFLIGYVLFNTKPGKAEVDGVEGCQRFLETRLEWGGFFHPA